MKRLTSIFLILCTVCLLLAPCAQAKTLYLRTTKTTDLYKSAGSGVIAKVYAGVQVCVEKRSGNGWAYVLLGAIHGYMRLSDLKDTEATPAYRYARVIKDCPAYDSIKTDAKKKTEYQAGTILCVAGYSDTWSIVSSGYCEYLVKTDALELFPDQGATLDFTVYAPVLRTETVKEGDADYYESPSFFSQAFYLFDDDPLNVIAETKDWVQFFFADRNYTTAFLPKSYFTAEGTEPVYAWVTGDNQNERLNLRYEPDVNASDSYGKYFIGTKVRVIGYLSEDWAQVSVGGRSGYMMTAYLSNTEIKNAALHTTTLQGAQLLSYTGSNTGTALETDTEILLLGTTENFFHVSTEQGNGYIKMQYIASNVSLSAKVSGGSLALRKEPDKSSSQLARIPENAAVTVLLHGDVWSRVEYKGKTGYVMTRYLIFQ